MNPEMRRVVTHAQSAARNGWSDGWSDADVAGLAAATGPLRVDESELQRVLDLPIADHGFREDVFTTDPAFHASVFGLKAGETIPLHDHPELDVITKVLRGRIRVRTFEWIDAANSIARERGEIVIGEDDDALVLRKSPGTLHTVTALEATAFLDLFAPYYDDVRRPCRYYAIAGSAAGRRRASRRDGGVPAASGNDADGNLENVQLRVVSWEQARSCPAPLTKV
ncbi:MAG: plant cysteine oxidase [Thermoanaerobaculia bacterium]|jgi:hypothetical protein|nr:plant cysteine oxidase [Thermoanaerobaculia bacterium]